MTMNKEATYAAVISLSLPGTNDVTTAHIVLTDPEMVKSGDQIKPLSECTLSDIRSFADSVERELWEVYQAIRLIEIAEDEAIEVDVTVLDKKGRQVSLQNWGQQAVLLAEQAEMPAEITELPADEIEALNEQEALLADEEVDEDEQSVDDTGSSEAGESETRSDEDETAPVLSDEGEAEQAHDESSIEEPTTPAKDLALEELVPQVTVSESEPVFAEVEAEEDPNAFPTPSIAPSQARVRIAGRRLPLGDNTWAAVDILVDEPALRAAQAHALSSPDREVAGVLLGPRPEKQPDGRYVVHVIDTIIAKYTVMHGASVTYTPESWRYMNDKLAERYPDETAAIVGWYHTHPGFGIFLSGMDQFIHQNFFTQIWHTALVLDPVSRNSGFFCWNREQNRVQKYEFSWPNWAVASW